MTDQDKNIAKVKERLTEFMEFLDESFTAENPMSKHASRSAVRSIGDVEDDIREWEGIGYDF